MTGPREAGPFPRKTTIWLAGGASLCLIASILLAILTGNTPAGRAGGNSVSGSALGHTAFVDLLRDSGIAVVVSRHATQQRTREASLLILIEPLAGAPRVPRGRLAQLVREAACPVILVLPKWRGVESPEVPGLLEAVVRRDRKEIQEVLSAVDAEAALLPTPVEPEGVVWTTTDRGIAPAIDDPQVVDLPPSRWRPLVAATAGSLIAQRKGGAPRHVIISDPDLLANHGLHHEDNARLALDIVSRLRSGQGPVLVDETLHGLGVAESFWAQLFAFPLGLATIQGAIAVALLLWAGMRRFGAPERAPPPFEPGKRFLIEQWAGLLEAGGHHGEALERYASLTIEDAARRLHAGSAGRASDLRPWLARLERRKRLRESVDALASETKDLVRRHPRDPRAALRVAGRLWHWKQEIVDESDGRPRPR